MHEPFLSSLRAVICYPEPILKCETPTARARDLSDFRRTDGAFSAQAFVADVAGEEKLGSWALIDER